MRKFFALAISLALLLGCFGIAAAATDTDPFRVVATYAGEDGRTLGLHWFSKSSDRNIMFIDGAPYVYDGANYSGSSVPFQGNYAHREIVKDLAPGPHTYKIGDVTGTFNVNPGKGNAFNFIVTGDTQASDAAGFAYSANTHSRAWEAFSNAAFSVILGDLTNDSNNAQWDMFFDAFAPFLARGALVPIAGNHDGMFKWNWFRNMFTLKEPNNLQSNLTGVYYSFDYGDAHIAVLNTNDMYPMSIAQQNWLVNDMKASDAKWKLVFMHRAPYTVGSHANDPDTLTMRRVLIPLFDRAGVDLVMSGHDHVYARTQPMYNDKPVAELLWPQVEGFTPPTGTTYILPGAACSKRYDLKDNILPAMRNAMVKHGQPGMPIFTGITIDGDTLTYEAYTCDPAAQFAPAPYDSLTITKTNFAGADPDFTPLPTSFLLTLPQFFRTFFNVVFGAIFVDYLFTLLPGLLGG